MAGMTCAAKRLKPAAREPTHYAPATDRKEGIRRGERVTEEKVKNGRKREGEAGSTAPSDSVAKTKAGATRERARAREKKKEGKEKKGRD